MSESAFAELSFLGQKLLITLLLDKQKGFLLTKGSGEWIRSADEAKLQTWLGFVNIVFDQI